MNFNILLEKIISKSVLKKYIMNSFIYQKSLEQKIFSCTIPNYQFSVVRCVSIFIANLVTLINMKWTKIVQQKKLIIVAFIT